MTIQEKLPEQVVDDDDAEAHNPLSEKAKEKEKFFQKMFAFIRSPFMLSRNKSGTIHATILTGDVLETMQLTSPRIGSKIKKMIRDEFGFRAPKQLVAELVEELQDQANDAPLEVHEVQGNSPPPLPPARSPRKTTYRPSCLCCQATQSGVDDRTIWTIFRHAGVPNIRRKIRKWTKILAKFSGCFDGLPK